MFQPSLLKVRVSLVAVVAIVVSSYAAIKGRYSTSGRGMVDSAPATLLFMMFVHGVLAQAFFYWRNPKMRRKVFGASKKYVAKRVAECLSGLRSYPYSCE